MSREYCIKCNQCLTREDNLCSISNPGDLEKLIKDIYVMTISWCTHVGDVEGFLINLCSKLNKYRDYDIYDYYFKNLKLKMTNFLYDKIFNYVNLTFYAIYIINNQETLYEFVNLISSFDKNKIFKIYDITTKNEINFSLENLNNYIGIPFRINTGVQSKIDTNNVLILTKESKFTTKKGIVINEIIGLHEYDSIPDESIIYIYNECYVDKFSLILSKTHELRETLRIHYYCVQKLPTKTKRAHH